MLIISRTVSSISEVARGLSEIRYDAFEGQIGRLIPARLKPGADLIEGIEKICKDFGVKNAFVCCSIGSLQKAAFQYLISKPQLKLKTGYGEPLEIPGPIELVAGMGIVCHNEKGEMVTHLHAFFSDYRPGPDHGYGGHIVKGKNPILATMDLLILEVKGVDITRKYDEETEIAVALEFKRSMAA
jgi:predicted DNA-binding protein with PD1-like motif